jgi:hypothetical protein
MPPASTEISTCPAPGAPGSLSSMRRSFAAWMTIDFMAAILSQTIGAGKVRALKFS